MKNFLKNHWIFVVGVLIFTAMIILEQLRQFFQNFQKLHTIGIKFVFIAFATILLMFGIKIFELGINVARKIYNNINNIKYDRLKNLKLSPFNIKTKQKRTTLDKMYMEILTEEIDNVKYYKLLRKDSKDKNINEYYYLKCDTNEIYTKNQDGEVSLCKGYKILFGIQGSINTDGEDFVGCKLHTGKTELKYSDYTRIMEALPAKGTYIAEDRWFIKGIEYNRFLDLRSHKIHRHLINAYGMMGLFLQNPYVIDENGEKICEIDIKTEQDQAANTREGTIGNHKYYFIDDDNKIHELEKGVEKVLNQEHEIEHEIDNIFYTIKDFETSKDSNKKVLLDSLQEVFDPSHKKE